MALLTECADWPSSRCDSLRREGCTFYQDRVQCGTCLQGFIEAEEPEEPAEEQLGCVADCSGLEEFCTVIGRAACDTTPWVCGDCLSGLSAFSTALNSPCVAVCEQDCAAVRRECARLNQCGECFRGFVENPSGDCVLPSSGCETTGLAADCASLHRAPCASADGCGICLGGFDSYAGEEQCRAQCGPPASSSGVCARLSREACDTSQEVPNTCGRCLTSYEALGGGETDVPSFVPCYPACDDSVNEVACSQVNISLTHLLRPVMPLNSLNNPNDPNDPTKSPSI